MAGFGNATIGKEFQGAVHSGIANTRVLLTQAQVQILRREVGTRAEEFLENDFALTCGFKATRA